MQTFFGVLAFLPAAYNRTIGLDTILNLAIPARGFLRHTKAATLNNDSDRHFMQLAAAYWVLSIAFNWFATLFQLRLSPIPALLLKTAVASIQWMAFARLWRLWQDHDVKQHRFYLNVAVLNKKEFIRAKVAEKVPSKLLGRLAGKIANKKVTDMKFLTTVGENIEQSMPNNLRLKTKGAISGRGEVKHKQANIIVVLVTIESVDIAALIKSKAGEEKAGLVSKVLEMLPSRVRWEIQAFFTSQIVAGMIKQLPDNMAQEMKEVAGLEVHVDAKTPEAEADFLFELLAQLEDSPRPAAA